jgi:hypothetical protein
MRNWSLLILLFILVGFVFPKKPSVADQQQDFKVFKSVLLAKEGRLDLHQSADSMLHYLSMLQVELSEEKSSIEQYKSYCKTLAKLGCGHTQLHPSKTILREWVDDGRSLPLDFIMQGKKVYVGKLQSEDYSIVNMEEPFGDRVRSFKGNYEILSIDHRTIPEIIEGIAPYISSDEDAIDFKYHQIAQLFDFYRHISAPFETDSVHLQYVKGDDTLDTYLGVGHAPINSINTRLQNASTEYAEMEKEIGSFVIHESKYGVFRFRSFSACNGAVYEDFLSRSFAKIRSKEIKHVIIDLRGNTGGVMQYSIMRYFVGADVDLGRYVVEKPKRFFENIHLKKRNGDYRRHKWMSRMQRIREWMGNFDNGNIKTELIEDEEIFDGEIVVITDEGTFSSAAMLACHLKTLCKAKLVGRPAGGSFYRGNAGTIYATLPKSKFQLMVNPNTFYSHLPESENPLEIKQPDVFLNPSFLKKRTIDEYYLEAAIKAFNENSL